MSDMPANQPLNQGQEEEDSLVNRTSESASSQPTLLTSEDADAETEITEASSNKNTKTKRNNSDLESQNTSEEEQKNGSSTVAPADQTTNSPPIVQYKLCKKYMKTPCGHSFHIMCLKKWMDIRLECPTCRQVIPQPDDD